MQPIPIMVRRACPKVATLPFHVPAACMLRFGRADPLATVYRLPGKHRSLVRPPSALEWHRRCGIPVTCQYLHDGDHYKTDTWLATSYGCPIGHIDIVLLCSSSSTVPNATRHAKMTVCRLPSRPLALAIDHIQMPTPLGPETLRWLANCTLLSLLQNGAAQIRSVAPNTLGLPLPCLIVAFLAACCSTKYYTVPVGWYTSSTYSRVWSKSSLLWSRPHAPTRLAVSTIDILGLAHHPPGFLSQYCYTSPQDPLPPIMYTGTGTELHRTSLVSFIPY